MLAVVREEWGGPEKIRLSEIPDPAPAPGEVLVRTRAASVNALDWRQLRGLPYVIRATGGVRRPKNRVLGVDLAGTVVAVGTGVTRFAPGDDVMGQSIRTFAESVAVRETSLVRTPAGVPVEFAAAVPLAGYTALQALRVAGMRDGSEVLVLGAGGGVGTLAVQLARVLGAGTVLATTRATSRDLVASLGADEVFDYARDDLASSGRRVDVVLDVSGVLGDAALRALLRPGGTAVRVGLSPFSGQLIEPLLKLRGPLRPTRGGRTVLPFLALRTTDDLQALADLLASGALRPAIDSIHPLSDAATALGRVGSGAARGKVVIAID